MQPPLRCLRIEYLPKPSYEAARREGRVGDCTDLARRANEFPKREARHASTVTPELRFSPFFVTDHVRPEIAAHWIFVPWGHRHQGSNRTEEAQVYPAARPSRSHMAPLQLQHGSRGPVQPVPRVAPRHSEAQSPRVGVNIRRLAQPCCREGVNGK